MYHVPAAGGHTLVGLVVKRRVGRWNDIFPTVQMDSRPLQTIPPAQPLTTFEELREHLSSTDEDDEMDD